MTTTRAPKTAGLNEAELVDLLMTRALWSYAEAAAIRATAGPNWALGGRELRPALAALIEDHDLNQSDAPHAGPERATSIWNWTVGRAGDVAAARSARRQWLQSEAGTAETLDPYCDAAVSLRAVRAGLPDPALLRLASSVLTIIPELVTADAHTDASTTRLLAQLDRL